MPPLRGHPAGPLAGAQPAEAGEVAAASETLSEQQLAERARRIAEERPTAEGVNGVHWQKEKQKWTANIRYKAKQIHLGFYAFLADAIKGRLLAEKAVAESKHPKPCDGKLYQSSVDHLAAARSAAGFVASSGAANKRRRSDDAGPTATIALPSDVAKKKARTSMPLPRSSQQPQASTAERLEAARELLVMERASSIELRAALEQSEQTAERLRVCLAAVQREAAALRAAGGDDGQCARTRPHFWR